MLLLFTRELQGETKDMKIKNMWNGLKNIREDQEISAGKQKFLDFCCSFVKIIFTLILAALTITSMIVTCSVDDLEVTSYGSDRIYLHILFAAAVLFLLIICRHIRNSLKGNWIEKVFQDLTKGINFNRTVIVFHFVLGVFWIVSTQVQTDADQFLCADVAVKQMFSDYNFIDYLPGGYMYNYPYQTGLVFVMMIVFRLFGSFNYLAFQLCNVFAMLLFDISVIKITAYIGTPSAKKVTGVMLVLFWPLLFYTVFVYGNLLGLAFGTAALYFEYRYFKKRRLRDIVISSVMIGLAAMMKTNYLIFLLAMLIFLILDFIVTVRKRTVFYLIFAVVCYVIGTTGPITLVSLQSGLDIGTGVPKIAFISMGMRESELAPGWWDDYYHEDLFRDSGYNEELTSEMAKADIEERLETFKDDPGYAAEFYYKKMVSQWCDPTFEGFWISRYEKGVTLSGIVDNILNRGLRGWITEFLNLYQTFIYGTSLLFVILNRKNRNIFLWLPATAVTGGFLFHMIWEAKSQYTFSYFVLLIPYSAIAAVQVMRWADERICPLLRRKRG